MLYFKLHNTLISTEHCYIFQPLIALSFPDIWLLSEIDKMELLSYSILWHDDWKSQPLRSNGQ